MLLIFMKYNFVGVVNTLIRFSIIFGLMYLDISAMMSNVIGTVIGVTVAYTVSPFIMAKYFTFKEVG